jgi:beta-glucosidase
MIRGVPLNRSIHLRKHSQRVLWFVLATSVCAYSQTAATFKREDADTSARQLLTKMTLAEKIGQMEQGAAQMATPAKTEQLIRDGSLGSMLFVTDPKRINELQHIAVEETRMHIPLLFGYDVIHGFRTIAPVPIAMASSWNPQLVTKTQAMAAIEARAAGIQWAFAPMVDISRDARWGRIMESAGEDPYLGEVMAAAQVRGFQGEVVGGPDHVLASTKHFAGYGAAEGGRDYESSDISEELLYNVYLRPFKAAVDAGSATLMSAYMDLNGVPATGNSWLLNDVLRKEWHFSGFVVSDWDAVRNLTSHGYSQNAADAARLAATAGLNMEMTGSIYRDNLPTVIKQSQLTEAQIDELVEPILAMKYRLGLFTNPYVDLTKYDRVTGSADQHRAVLAAAEQSAVLLRNQSNALPLSKSIHSIAILGPLADSKVDTLGSWSLHGDRENVVTVADGIRQKLPTARIDVATGVEIVRSNRSVFDAQFPPLKPTLTTEDEREKEFQHALTIARAAEVSILVLGEAQNMSGENASRGSLALPGEQERLLEAVVGLGKPVVLVLLTGRPLDISWANGHVDAILNAWYPGSEGGHAVVNLLFGDAVPAGHLPISWPRSAAQEPLFYNAKLPMDPWNNGHRYWDLSSQPLYPFGFGLTYADITTNDLKVQAPLISPKDTLTVSVKVKNQSDRAGTQVVQLYTHQRFGSSSRPSRELKAFQRVTLAAHAVQTIEMNVKASDLTYWSPSLRRWVLEPSIFDVWVGVDSTASLHDTFQVMTTE